MPPRTRRQRYYKLAQAAIAIIQKERFLAFWAKFKVWVRQHIVQMPGVQTELLQYFWFDDWHWLELNLQAVDSGVPSVLPKLPSDSIQTSFVGSSGEQALREGFNFYRICKAQANTYGIKITRNTKILDFGMGWGRILRFWLKDVDTKNLWGVDVDSEMVELCRCLFNCCNFATGSPEPPSQFASDTFVIIYAYSVFSHLAEETAKRWIAEFSRILRPGGIVVATTQSRRFIKSCESLRSKPPPPESVYLTALAKSFVDTEDSLRRYDEGEFLYSPTGGGGPRDKSFYGEALFSCKYVVDNWSGYLQLRDFIDDANYDAQSVMVLQKTQ
jgi:SAM-dependent methyltransferase